MKTTVFSFLIMVLILAGSLEGALRYSNWTDQNIVEGWGRLRGLQSGSTFKPKQSVTLAREEFSTNSAGERDQEHGPEKSQGEIRIGVFGGLNVLGFTMPSQKTLSHFMKINPAPTCELQGRNCEYFSYGRINLSAADTVTLIQKKIKDDGLDIAIWVVDPLSEVQSFADVPWTPSLAINWLVSPLAWKALKKSLQSPSTPDAKVFQTVLPPLRQSVFASQKDLIPVIIPAMDKSLGEHKDWEHAVSAAFFTQGFLPVRAKTLIQESTRKSLSLKDTALMGDEALRALASLLRERIEVSPQMKSHR